MASPFGQRADLLKRTSTIIRAIKHKQCWGGGAISGIALETVVEWPIERRPLTKVPDHLLEILSSYLRRKATRATPVQGRRPVLRDRHESSTRRRDEDHLSSTLDDCDRLVKAHIIRKSECSFTAKVLRTSRAVKRRVTHKEESDGTPT